MIGNYFTVLRVAYRVHLCAYVYIQRYGISCRCKDGYMAMAMGVCVRK